MFSRELQRFLIWLLIVMVMMRGSTAVVTIENNGYKGLVVAINKNISENTKLIDQIKEMLTNASKYLHFDTDKRAFFEEITIVVPASWSSSTNYESVQGGDYFSRAEVRVDEANPNYGDDPYTLQPGECGEPGEYIHLTPEFLLGDESNHLDTVGDGEASGSDIVPSSQFSYGDLGKVFVHEWAHLRYGTFDEYGFEFDDQMPMFYKDQDNMIRPTGCPDDIRGWIRDVEGAQCVLGLNGLPNSQCVFYPDLGYSTTVDATHSKPSIMYLPGFQEADGFCKDDNSEGRKHNSLAPNRHNIMCQGRATWEVIFNHADFNNTNQPRKVTSFIPKFRVVQPNKVQHPTCVLVLDTSGSMAGEKIKMLGEMTSRFLKYYVPNGSKVGMIAFSGSTRILAKMTLISPQTKDNLLRSIPKSTDGGTAIGKGIQAAIKLLRDNGDPTDGSLILLVTDGEENEKPNIIDVIPEIKQSKVIINTMAFGQEASNKLESLLKATGGRGYFFDNTKDVKKLDTAFVESAATLADIDFKPIEIVDRSVSLSGSNKPEEGNFFVDEDIGHSTTILATYNCQECAGQSDPLELIVTDPLGKEYSSKSDPVTFSVGVSLDKAPPGKWKYSLKSKLQVPMQVTLSVSSQPLDVKEQPIRVRSWVSNWDINSPSKLKVYAEIKKGYRAIVGATVIGKIGRPEGHPTVLMLLDNGAGADNVKGDGIYSGFFTEFNGKGRYSVEAAVVDNGKAMIDLGKHKLNSKAPKVHILPKKFRESSSKNAFEQEELRKPTEAELLEEQKRKEAFEAKHYKNVSFERTTSAGAFRVDNFQPGIDILVPSRVNDLTVQDANVFNLTVRLKWTSPGDDMEDGQGVVTEVRCHEDPSSLRLFFNATACPFELIEGNFTPPVGRKPHEVTIQLDPVIKSKFNSNNFRLYFDVRTKDEAGNQGEASNMPMAIFQTPIVPSSSPQTLKVVNWVIVAMVTVIIGHSLNYRFQV